MSAHTGRVARAEIRDLNGDGNIPWLTVLGARHNNLQNIDVAVPLQRFVCVTGVSGSGKSSLVNDILAAALARDLNGATNVEPGRFERIDGLTHLDKVIVIDQSPIGRTPRSNPATYIKVFNHIRDLFARLPDSKVRGYRPGRFSFNVYTGRAGGGRCEACEGNGQNRMEMDFLADVWVTCPMCNGRRFSRETLHILYKGKSIADVLNMDVQQALTHFANVPKIADMLRTLHDVGLDYIKLGQSSTTLSGGEAQRIKLARELVKKSTGRTLYILDEPTTGLHFDDIKKLLNVLHRFVDGGNTVLVIEHNLDVIKTADWLIDLGPEGGEAGGRIVAEGTPEELALCNDSHTGLALRSIPGIRENCRLPNVDSRINEPINGRSRRGRTHRQSTINNGQSHITVVGAKQHNLKDITVKVPRGRLTVCCGPSGSGKSSFAIDTVYTEGQRRYVESLSAYARQFLSRLQPPRVDHIDGLSPAVCIEQKNTGRSPRSTVGTVTEIYDYMRILWARIGRPHCPKCNIPVGTQTSEEIVEKILALGEGKRLILLAPIEPAAGESYDQLLKRQRANGFARARIDGSLTALDESIALNDRQRHSIELVIDRIVVQKSRTARITDSVEQALTIGDGVLIAQLHPEDGARTQTGNGKTARRQRKTSRAAGEHRFSQHRSCERCGKGFDELTPHHFSFNSRMGWCPACEGLGVQLGASASAIVVHPTRSLADGAITGWESLAPGTMLHAFVSALAFHLGCDLHTPWLDLDERHRHAILHGCGEDWIGVDLDADGSSTSAPRASARAKKRKPTTSAKRFRFQWQGFYPAIHRATQSSWQYRQRLESMVTEVPCDACAGGRLRSEPAAVRIADATIHDVCRRSLAQTLQWFEKLRLPPRERTIAGELLREITSRLRFLVEVGLDYITLHRTASTLSGGEAQRIQLASQIGTGLTGVLYVLDEPTIGLHPRDNARLIRALRRLRDLGNTLLVVEHDREVINSADRILDFGPGAGIDGGQVVADATPKRVRNLRASLTGRYLSCREAIPVPTDRRPLDDDVKWLTVHDARENNLKEIDAAFPLGRFICVTGVSGSGKSTLVADILYNALAVRIHRARLVPGGHERISGVEHIDKVINVDQSPIGNSPTSNPATYTGVFDAIRGLFAKLPLSRIRGYTANRFSFNRLGGRCEACEGMGQRCIEMHFLPDVWVECESCKGSRYVPETLEVRYRGRSIADVLNMRVSEALQLFENVPAVYRMLQTLDDVGLGYVQLGQAAPTLSGGEAQRVKLAAELGRPSTGKTLYLLDEPTTGLHFDDLKKLLAVLHRLVDRGNTCICIEHNLDVIKTADWVIDLGPEAGDAGGTIVVAGPPEDVAATACSHTGVALQPVLEAGPHAPRASMLHKRTRAKHVMPDKDVMLSAAKHLNEAKHLAAAKHPPQSPAVAADTDDVPMPWERDGRKWHTVDHRDARGTPVEWNTQVLAWLVETIESLKVPHSGEKVEWITDWNHRARVEIKAAGSERWFCHFLTGGKDLLETAVRVPDGTFNESALTKRLGIKTLDERTDLPIYGQWDRVRRRALAEGWEEWRLYLRDFTDVNKRPFRTFLKGAAETYARRVQESQSDPAKAAPWLQNGREWHLSQQSIMKRSQIRWKPAVLLSLIGRFKALEPKLNIDWANKSAVHLSLPGRPQPLAKIVTNISHSLRVELRAPSGVLTPVQIDRLGEDATVNPQKDHDRVVFRVRSLTQNDAKQLAKVWRLCAAHTSVPSVQFV